jgi:hypothetical protein
VEGRRPEYSDLPAGESGVREAALSRGVQIPG